MNVSNPVVIPLERQREIAEAKSRTEAHQLISFLDFASLILQMDQILFDRSTCSILNDMPKFSR
ncbi:hypothetical protein C1J05_11200 [Sulfitobacter sp. JL08]|nr:hypothetical protein C1J05_11200 [Sulfitobacter sp. JL08]